MHDDVVLQFLMKFAEEHDGRIVTAQADFGCGARLPIHHKTRNCQFTYEGPFIRVVVQIGLLDQAFCPAFQALLDEALSSTEPRFSDDLMHRIYMDDSEEDGRAIVYWALDIPKLHDHLAEMYTHWWSHADLLVSQIDAIFVQLGGHADSVTSVSLNTLAI